MQSCNLDQWIYYREFQDLDGVILLSSLLLRTTLPWRGIHIWWCLVEEIMMDNFNMSRKRMLLKLWMVCCLFGDQLPHTNCIYPIYTIVHGNFWNIYSSSGTLEFTTYDEKPVNPCQDKQGLYYTAAERSGCTNESIANITIGIIYNDVWAYKLCPINSSTATSTRYFNSKHW